MWEAHSDSRRGACQGVSFLTGESVSTFVRQVPDSINDCLFSRIGIEMPLNPGITTVLSQTWKHTQT